MKYINNRKTMIAAAGLLLFALISFFILADSSFFSSINSNTIAYLDEKREEVMMLTVASGVFSTTISAIPGDIGTPVAENIADIADYLIIVFGGIWVQKYLVSLATALTFKVFIPLSCLLTSLNLFLKLDSLKTIAIRVTMFSMLILFLVPSSVWLSKHIENTYHYSVQQKIEEIESTSQEVEEDKNIFEKLINSVTDIKEKIETTLANMLEATVVLIITSCIIPLLVFLIFIKAFNFIFGTSFPVKPYKSNFFGNIVEQQKKAKSEKSSNQIQPQQITASEEL